MSRGQLAQYSPCLLIQTLLGKNHTISNIVHFNPPDFTLYNNILPGTLINPDVLLVTKLCKLAKRVELERPIIFSTLGRNISSMVSSEAHDRITH